MSLISALIRGYRLRAKRRYLLWRAIRAGRGLIPVADRSRQIGRDQILLFACIRNEAARLPFFLRHYRALGVDHFLIVDNGSTDATTACLSAEPDVSLWRAPGSYRASRFGMDWINGLLLRHGHGHWCLTVDADEILILPTDAPAPLRAMTADLAARGAEEMGALMLDLYPRGPLSVAHCAPGEDPAGVLDWFDPGGYTWEYQPRFGNISIRGGVRKRVFFAATPERAPHLHKIPLIRWHWRYAYVSSTHIALPRRLNGAFDAREGLPTGVLLHNKFLDEVIPRSRDEKHRREHFTHAALYDSYYDRIAADPVLWHPGSAPLRGWRDLVDLGLMTPGRPGQTIDNQETTS